MKGKKIDKIHKLNVGINRIWSFLALVVAF